MNIKYVCSFLLLCCCLTETFAEEDHFTEDGYRNWPYKAPTPDSAPGSTALFFTEDVQQIINQEAVILINVSPVTLSPANIDGDRFWIPSRNHSPMHIPGSIWLPNVGYAKLEEHMRAYLESNLYRVTRGDKSRPLLFYCTADCWMSWNTVKRVHEELGYRNVYWYPYGIDGWKEDGLPLEYATPVPFQGR